MADDKQGRDDQARGADDRQRRRAVLEELERMDEVEPPVEADALDDVEAGIRSLEYPVTAAAVVEAVGDREVESTDGTYTVAELVPRTDEETYDSPDEVRARVLRPTVAASMKRITEASRSLPRRDRFGSQREAYEKTLRALKSIDADDDDEGVESVTDWIVERIEEKGKLPSSRDVRRRAAKFCRSNGYEVRNDQWLGV
ncbi:MAG: hypothetical protein ABEJ40_01235 [Haloarculaceae archaeon]